MKTKKVLALVVLAAFLISIVPFAAFATINNYSSVVKAPTDSVEAQATGAAGNDGAEFTVVINDPAKFVGGEYIYITTSRDSVDFIADKGTGSWVSTGTVALSAPYATKSVYRYQIPAAAAGFYSHSIDFKVVSTAAGTSNVVFGTDPTAVYEYAQGISFTGTLSTADIIQQKKYPVEFTAAKADGLTVKLGDGFSFNAAGTELSTPVKAAKPANGVDTYKVQAFVTANNAPVAGKEVNFSITSGNGATLTATKATTDVTGKAEVKIYSTKADVFTVKAKSGSLENTAFAKFATPGIVSIKAESDNNQKVARDQGNFTLKFSAYDAAGSKVNYQGMNTGASKVNRAVVTKPSGSGISDSSGTSFTIDDTNSDGYGRIVIDTNLLKKDGDYEVKVYLDNGSTVAYKFNVKEQGEVVKMELDYGATSFAAESTLPIPDIKYFDAEGYKVTKAFTATSNVKLSISDASFLDATGLLANGSFKLNKDKTGVITMTAVDTSKNLVATQVINVQKSASYLKLTPQSVGAIGEEVTVNIELVDVDGKLAATNYTGALTTSATIIARPEGAMAYAGSFTTTDYKEGKASVKVSSNMEGDVTLQVIISQADNKVYTGACTVSFGKASVGGGQLIFIIGSPSFVAGNKVYGAESPSFIDNGRTFLGVRDMGTSIGATVEWDQASQTASLTKDGVTVKVTVGASKIAVTKNGVTSEVSTDAAAQNKNGRVYLPFRAVLEAFNYTVTYDQATNSIVCAL